MSDTNPQDDVTPNSQEPQAVAQPVVQSDPNSLFANQLSEIKTEDGRQKYADVQTALASVPHAQTHIAEQATKIKELEDTIAKQQGMEAVLEQLKSQQTVTEQPSVNGIDETTLASMLDAKLAERDGLTLAKNNQDVVLNKLSTKFGDKAEERFSEKAATLGVTVGFLSDLARKAPDAVLAYFSETAQPSSNPTEGSINTQNFNTQQPADNEHLRIFSPGMSDNMVKWKAVAK